jgi:hypothetical protein
MNIINWPSFYSFLSSLYILLASYMFIIIKDCDKEVLYQDLWFSLTFHFCFSRPVNVQGTIGGRTYKNRKERKENQEVLILSSQQFPIPQINKNN